MRYLYEMHPIAQKVFFFLLIAFFLSIVMTPSFPAMSFAFIFIAMAIFVVLLLGKAWTKK